MSYLLGFLLLVALASIRPVYVWGEKNGRALGVAATEGRWERLRRTPIAGQKVDIPGLGAVMVLGLGSVPNHDSTGFVESIDFIPIRVLGDKLPSEIDADVLDRNTVSTPLDQFVAQAEVSLKYL